MKIKVILLTVLYIITPFFVNAQNKPDQKTESVKMDLNKDFYVIAHRGVSAYYPENTMSAFRASAEINADMIELDVLLSKDKIPVVFHDAKLDKRSNGKGLVSDFTFEELRELDAGSWFSEKFKGEKIPSLREVLEFTKNKILVNIEIKTEAVSTNEEGGVVELVIQLVNELSIQEQVIISSFDYRVLERLKKQNDQIRTAMLYERRQSGKRNPVELVSDYNVDAFNFGKQYLSQDWIEMLNENHIPFFVYTVNDEETMEKIIESGAKGIFSDKPALLRKVHQDLSK